jgi:O-antigen ligase
MRQVRAAIREERGIWLCGLALAAAIGGLPFAALAVLAPALAALAALLSPATGVALVVLSVPAQQLVVLPGGLSFTQAAVLLTIGGWGLRRLAFPEESIRTSRLFPFWCALLGALLLSAAFTPYARGEALRELLRWCIAASVALIAADCVRSPRQLAMLAACLIIAPTECAAIGLGQFVSGDGPPTFRIDPQLPFVRAYGTIGQPNSFAGYLNMAWPLALALSVAMTAAVRQKRERVARPLVVLAAVALWICTAVLLGGLAASFSRGAWLGAAAGVFGMALALGRRSALAALGGAGGLIALLALGGAGILPDAVAARLASITRSLSIFDAATVAVTPENFAVVERMAQLQAGWRMLLSSPLLGIGPGNYSVAYPTFAVGEWYISRGHAHNFYLHIAAEAGVVGLAAYLALVGAAVALCIRGLRRAQGVIARGVVAGCCGMIAAVAAHQLFENLHVLNMTIQYATVLALAEATTDSSS